MLYFLISHLKVVFLSPQNLKYSNKKYKTTNYSDTVSAKPIFCWHPCPRSQQLRWHRVSCQLSQQHSGHTIFEKFSNSLFGNFYQNIFAEIKTFCEYLHEKRKKPSKISFLFYVPFLSVHSSFFVRQNGEDVRRLSKPLFSVHWNLEDTQTNKFGTINGLIWNDFISILYVEVIIFY